MTGLEITALSVVCVVLYFAGAGIAFRLMGAPEEGPYLTEPGVAPCGCRYTRNYAGELRERCPKHIDHGFTFFFSCIWPVILPFWIGFHIVGGIFSPLVSVFRVCAGLEKEKGDAIDG